MYYILFNCMEPNIKPYVKLSNGRPCYQNLSFDHKIKIKNQKKKKREEEEVGQTSDKCTMLNAGANKEQKGSLRLRGYVLLYTTNKVNTDL